MDPSGFLSLLDKEARSQAFELCFKKLEDGPSLDLGALQTCIQLLPSSSFSAQENRQETSSYHKLLDLLVSRLPRETQDMHTLYQLTETIFSNAALAESLFMQRLWSILDALYLEVTRLVPSNDDLNEAEQQILRRTRALLTVFQTSYWLPSHKYHVLDPDTPWFLGRFISLPAVADVAHDALSALFTLLRRTDLTVVANSVEPPPSWLRFDGGLGSKVLCNSIVDASIWNQLRELPLHHFRENTSKIFRTWFQWISQVRIDRIKFDGLEEELYWQRLQVGLLHGFADQRKYCIGIIRQSLLASQNDISTPSMRFEYGRRDAYLKAYERFSVLLEIIVLDRYANQVQACLPELTKLLQSEVTSSMVTTLLTAALHPIIQEPVRKIVGNWYINYVVKHRGSIQGQASFLLTGFISWATIGDLFTSTVVSTRSTTYCAHGASVAQVICRFVSENSKKTASNRDLSDLSRNDLIIGIVDFVLAARGKIFQASVLYLLEGLTLGLGVSEQRSLLSTPFSEQQMDKILQLSRLPGLPEVASHLYCQYCYRLCHLISFSDKASNSSGYKQLRSRAEALSQPVEENLVASRDPMGDYNRSSTLQEMVEQLASSKHKSLQGSHYVNSCRNLLRLLDQVPLETLDIRSLYTCLDALWEEADRREFARSVSVHLPPILLHATSIKACITEDETFVSGVNVSLRALLSKAIVHLQRLSGGRSYITASLASCLRKAVLLDNRILGVLPIEDYVTSFVNSPPSAKVEFLFEVAAAEKLQKYHPHRDYSSYYGQREWCAYAAVIDLIQRLPCEPFGVGQRLLDQLLAPWRDQRVGGPIITKWKNVLQLQAMLLLSDSVISVENIESYLASFRQALVLEAWPRYRFLLEWIIARMYCRHPDKAAYLLDDLACLNDNSATQIASLIKLAVLVAPYQPETFSAMFMTHLVPCAASPKVQMRHESNYAIPIIFDLAREKGWQDITENPGFVSLDAFIRKLDKFNVAPWTIRTLKLDAMNDFTLVNIFQGPYLTIEAPEKQRVAYEDFVALYEADRASGLDLPPACVPLGSPPAVVAPDKELVVLNTSVDTSPAFFQTKSGFDIDSLHPLSGSPEYMNQRPASVILIASLIDNPTNLGGLSRISESFGLEALYIDDLKKMAHKDFKATSVTSEKHVPIHQLKPASVPEFLLDAKIGGYEVVGIEQTDRSGILGTGNAIGSHETLERDKKELGTLPKKCVLVLGSEKGGITAEVLAVVDRCVEIRTVGLTRSLNVQTAGGIAVYEWWREWYDQK